MPSAKSWARTTRTPGAPTIPSPKFPIDLAASQRKDKWTISRGKGSDTLLAGTAEKKEPLSAPHVTGIHSSFSATAKNLGKWSLPKPSSVPQTAPTLKDAGNKPANNAQAGSSSSARNKWIVLPPESLPSHHKQPLNTTTFQNRHGDVKSSSFEHARRSNITHNTFKLPIDHSPSEIFHDDEEPRRQTRWTRNAPPRNERYEYRRREQVKMPLVKKQVQRKPKHVALRRKDIYIPSTVTVATLAKLLKIKLGTHCTCLPLSVLMQCVLQLIFSTKCSDQEWGRKQIMTTVSIHL